MTKARAATAIAAILVLAACNRGPGNNVVAAGPANVAATATQAAPAAPAAAPAVNDPVRTGIASRWPAGAPVTPVQVREMIRASNATDAMIALVGREERSRWATILRGIALGEPQWLELATVFAPVVDGEAAEGFYAALSDTLVTSPAAAVRLIGIDGAEGYCTDNGSVSDPAQQRAWYAAAIAGVEGVTEPDLQAARTACLARLRAESPR